MQYIDDSSHQYINEVYKIWKKHAPLLYNFLQVYHLPSTSNTIDSFAETYIQSTCQVNSLLIGSNSLTKNYLSVVDIMLPTDETILDNSQYQQIPSNNEIGSMGQQMYHNRIILPQNSQIMRARINKNQQNLIACKTGGNDYELNLYNLNYDYNHIQDNKMQLLGHLSEGYGLSWHPNKSNIIISASYDKKILMWDINITNHNTITPILQANHHDPIEDVKWSTNDNLMGSVGQEKIINIWDIRQDCTKPSVSKIAGSGELYTLDFNPFTEHLLATGGEDGDIMIWDIRNMSKKIHSLIGHNDAVNVVSWSKVNPIELVSGSSDRRIVVWSMDSKQILFIHGGHRSKITDVTWINKSYSLGSCEVDNIMQVWSMNEKIYK